jgi:hypothetical protein
MRAPGDASVLDQDRHANPAVRHPFCRRVMVLGLRTIDSHPLSVWSERAGSPDIALYLPLLTPALGRGARAGFRESSKPATSNDERRPAWSRLV